MILPNRTTDSIDIHNGYIFPLLLFITHLAGWEGGGFTSVFAQESLEGGGQPPSPSNRLFTLVTKFTFRGEKNRKFSINGVKMRNGQAVVKRINGVNSVKCSDNIAWRLSRDYRV
ncbi:hypothetical protein AVEN_82175-1 [Araneus ventricosus]|uniref:Uncharacterized protein n=1 Tax=Araneus ventricosus TaxID=182803 RepID=A0A4Y2IXH0_ARAVE|nr:hypothetical protein AVEN_82175-1 [Araneus ventricosus]